MRRMCKFSAIIYEKYHKSLCIMEASTCWLQTFFSSLRLRKKIVFVEMLYLRTSGDGASWRWVLYQKRFLSILVAKSKKRERKAWTGVGTGEWWKFWVGVSKGRRNRMNSSPPLFAACLQWLLLFGGQWTYFYLFFLRWFRLDKV